MNQNPAQKNGNDVPSQEYIIVSESSERQQQATQQVEDPALDSLGKTADFVNINELQSQNPEVTKPKKYTQPGKSRKTKIPSEDIYAAEREKWGPCPEKKDIVKVGALKMKYRNQALPSAWDDAGRLRLCWGFRLADLRIEVAAQEAQEAQQQQNSSHRALQPQRRKPAAAESVLGSIRVGQDMNLSPAQDVSSREEILNNHDSGNSLDTPRSTEDIHDASDRAVIMGSSREHLPSPIIHGPQSIARLLEPKFGNERVLDDVIRSPLRKLSGVLDNYSARASIKSAFPNAQISIWEQAWIQDEIRSPAAGLESTRPVLPVLRKLLDVPEGVLIKEKINTCQLYGYRNLIWIRAVLVSLVSEFVFNQGSPLESNGFESDDSLRQCLEECGFQPDWIDKFDQDNRIRAVRANPAPKNMSERMRSQHQAFLQRLNRVMLPLVGADSVFNNLHNSIVEIAQDLNVKIWTDVKGEFAKIEPTLGDDFDPHQHKPKDRDRNRDKGPDERVGQYILATAMVGIKRKVPGGEWRVCSHAEVELLQVQTGGKRKRQE